MSRWHGAVGYATDVETYPGVWEPSIVDRPYFGNLTKNRTNLQQTSQINSGITFNHTLSIVADPYAYENFYAIKYITHLGKKWMVTNIELEYPRIIVTLGGMYNG